MPPAIALTDLDQRPELAPAVLALFAACPPGANHLVCGLPAHMGLEPTGAVLGEAAGVLVALADRRAAGALAIYPYSEEQVTLWGPAILTGLSQSQVPDLLVNEARRALHAGGFTSMRSLVDIRNRHARVLLQAHGFASWKNNHFCERDLAARLPAAAAGVRLAASQDHGQVVDILMRAFPDSDHCLPNLHQREQQGYRHYLLEEADGIAAVAAVQGGGRRSWLKLVAMRQDLRGKHLSRRLLEGVILAEAKCGMGAIGLEVLADNAPAIALYESVGFQRRWTATIMTGPV